MQQSLPHLPQPRPSSGSSPSSRNRSVQRLRAAVSEIRHSWAADDDDDEGEVAASASPHRAAQGNTPSISRDRPMIVRMPVAAAHHSPGGGAASSAGGTDHQQHLHSGGLAPMPQSPYVLYTGDPSPSAVAAMVRGAKIVRAHGLRESDDPITNTHLFGAYSPKKHNHGSPTSSGSRPPSGGRARGSNNNNNNSGRSSSRTGDEDGASTTRSSTTINTARLEKQTEEELAARTNDLMPDDIRPLMEPKSIFYTPSLLSSGPLAPQIVDEFTAGNVRKKMVGVIHREATNNAAIKALSKAQGAVREHDRILRKEREENEKHSSALLDETVSPDDVEGGGGGHSRRKEKDSETIAKEKAVEAEAARVRGACELMRSGRLEGSNHAVLFARIRRILTVPPGGGRTQMLCVHSRRLLQLLTDNLDVDAAATLPQWEILAHKELQAAEAARVARESKSYRRGNQQQNLNSSGTTSSLAPSPSGAGVGSGGSSGVQRPPSGGAGEGGEPSAAAAGLEGAAAEGSSGGLKAEESDPLAHNASFRSPSVGNFLNSPTSAAGGADPDTRLLPLLFPRLQEFCRRPCPGSLLRSLAEETVAMLLDPAQLTAGRVLADTGFSTDGKPLSAIAAASPTGELSSCWQPPLRVDQVSRLADGLLRCLTSTDENRKTSLAEAVVTSAFNFMRAAVDARNDWTAVCNSVEDMYAKSAARAAAVAEHGEKSRALAAAASAARGGGGGSVSRARGRSPTQQQHGGGGGGPSPSSNRGRSPPSGGTSPVSNNSPSRGAATAAQLQQINPRSPTTSDGRSVSHNFFGDGGADGEVPEMPEVPLPTPERDGVPRHAFLSERPSSMSKEFFELEYVAFEEFSEFQHIMLERRHFKGAPAEEAERESFTVVRSAMASVASAFRLVLQEEQIAALTAGKKKKRKINVEDLPPVFPNKQSVLRFKDFRHMFLTQEKVSGPLLPFVLATIVDNLSFQHYQGQQSRWREAAPLSAYF